MESSFRAQSGVKSPLKEQRTSKNALLIIDETDGREVARRLGIRLTGTIGLLVEAKLKGLIPEVRSQLNRLKETSNFRFTEQLFAAALQKAGEQPA